MTRALKHRGIQYWVSKGVEDSRRLPALWVATHATATTEDCRRSPTLWAGHPRNNLQPAYRLSRG
jgi:hypothetical protein